MSVTMLLITSTCLVLSRCLDNGWTITGAKDHLKLVSPDNTKSILFDLVVSIPKGAVFATVDLSPFEVKKYYIVYLRMVVHRVKIK